VSPSPYQNGWVDYAMLDEYDMTYDKAVRPFAGQVTGLRDRFY
jgi:hypothetical protein